MQDSFDTSFTMMSTLVTIMFIIVIAFFIITAVKGIGQWHHNNEAPLLCVEASVVTKRTSVTHHHHSDANMGTHGMTNTDYYVTFETDTNSRLEFHVSGREYGQLAEGDRGKLTFQGTRYQRFERY